MKVLFFNYEYPPLGGGAANATSYILREFSKTADLEVDLVTSSIDDKYCVENIGANVKIHRLPIGKDKSNLHFQSQKDLIIYSWKAYFYAWKLAKKNNYDLTHSFFSVPCGFLSLALKFQFGLPYIISLRGADVPGYSERFSLNYKILTPLIRFIWSQSGAVISASDGLRELALKAKTDQKIDVICNGIDIEEFKPIRSSTSLEVELPKFKILCVSRLTRRKGIEYLIKALPKIIEKNPNAELHIAGEGDYKKDLEKISEDLGLQKSITFMGLVPHVQLPQIYSGSDVFVLPSLNEGMSNTMLEALASGLPLVATDTGGTKELVTDGQNGFIVRMQDPDDLAEKIGKIMSDGMLAKKMSQESRKKAEQMSWKSVAEKYLERYRVIK